MEKSAYNTQDREDTRNKAIDELSGDTGMQNPHLVHALQGIGFAIIYLADVIRYKV